MHALQMVCRTLPQHLVSQLNKISTLCRVTTTNMEYQHAVYHVTKGYSHQAKRQCHSRSCQSSQVTINQKLKYRQFQIGFRQYKQAFSRTHNDIIAAIGDMSASQANGPYTPCSPASPPPGRMSKLGPLNNKECTTSLNYKTGEWDTFPNGRRQGGYES